MPCCADSEVTSSGNAHSHAVLLGPPAASCKRYGDLCCACLNRQHMEAKPYADRSLADGVAACCMQLKTGVSHRAAHPIHTP